jgi:hypothetical protein
MYMAGKRNWVSVAATLLVLAMPSGWAQSDTMSHSILAGSAVEFQYPEQITVPAGKTTTVALHFRVAQGLHINSHTPRDQYLIPTAFSIPDGTGVQLSDAVYPPGKDFTLPAAPADKLSVYTDEFVIQAKIVAPAGNHLVQAKLHFQACNNAMCMPPKTIPVAIDVIGK